MFDGRAEAFDAARYAELSGSLPRVVEPAASIVSTISVPEATNCTQPWGEAGYLDYKGDCHRGLVQVGAVLTVLDAPPPDGSFRPPYAGTEKPLYAVADVRWDRLLALAPEPDAPDITELTETWGRVRLDIKTNSAYDQVYPIDCVAGSASANYGAQIAMSMGEAALTLLSDDSRERKELLMIRFLQHGIDQFGALVAGAAWIADGGLKSGRKFPIVWAGHFLSQRRPGSLPHPVRPRHRNRLRRDGRRLRRRLSPLPLTPRAERLLDPARFPSLRPEPPEAPRREQRCRTPRET
ncbi:MAG: hypothetical protein JXB32_11295 [Deltaproteobacteria bacterium]|nr:hypothetical protein [Deltaproteobacteria bacterium]